MFVFYNGNYYLVLLLNLLINREFRSGCPAKAVTIGANLITISNEHNHNPDQHGLTCELIEREVINRCCVYDTNRSIIAEIKQTLNSEGLGGKISKKENLTRRSQRKRTSVKNEGVPIKTYADLHLLSEDYKNYQNRPFLVLNSAIKDKNILIFMASNGYEILNNSSTWALDGTHRKTPAPFSQIYIIGGMQNSRFLPACYCLVPNHESVTYTIILNFLKDFVKFNREYNANNVGKQNLYTTIK